MPALLSAWMRAQAVCTSCARAVWEVGYPTLTKGEKSSTQVKKSVETRFGKGY